MEYSISLNRNVKLSPYELQEDSSDEDDEDDDDDDDDED